jgi:hypothetical protein
MSNEHPWRAPLSRFNAKQTRRDGESLRSEWAPVESASE